MAQRIKAMPYKDPADQKRYRAKWHADNYPNFAERHKLAVKQRKEAAQKYITEYKAQRGCARCPEKEPCCLDFHHSSGQKEDAISRGVHNGWSIAHIQSEIEKCTILCANCHRKHHAGVAQLAEQVPSKH